MHQQTQLELSKSILGIVSCHHRQVFYLNRRPGKVGESGIVLLDEDFFGKWKGNFLSILGESERSDCCRCVM